jgi:excisionase family DNA binding protein
MLNFTISEVAEMLKVSESTLRNWDRCGKLKPDSHLGNHRRYSDKLLDEFVKQNRFIEYNLKQCDLNEAIRAINGVNDSNAIFQIEFTGPIAELIEKNKIVFAPSHDSTICNNRRPLAFCIKSSDFIYGKIVMPDEGITISERCPTSACIIIGGLLDFEHTDLIRICTNEIEFSKQKKKYTNLVDYGIGGIVPEGHERPIEGFRDYGCHKKYIENVYKQSLLCLTCIGLQYLLGYTEYIFVLKDEAFVTE